MAISIEFVSRPHGRPPYSRIAGRRHKTHQRDCQPAWCKPACVRPRCAPQCLRQGFCARPRNRPPGRRYKPWTSCSRKLRAPQTNVNDATPPFSSQGPAGAMIGRDGAAHAPAKLLRIVPPASLRESGVWSVGSVWSIAIFSITPSLRCSITPFPIFRITSPETEQDVDCPKSPCRRGAEKPPPDSHMWRATRAAADVWGGIHDQHRRFTL